MTDLDPEVVNRVHELRTQLSHARDIRAVKARLEAGRNGTEAPEAVAIVAASILGLEASVEAFIAWVDDIRRTAEHMDRLGELVRNEFQTELAALEAALPPDPTLAVLYPPEPEPEPEEAQEELS